MVNHQKDLRCRASGIGGNLNRKPKLLFAKEPPTNIKTILPRKGNIGFMISNFLGRLLEQIIERPGAFMKLCGWVALEIEFSFGVPKP